MGPLARLLVLAGLLLAAGTASPQDRFFDSNGARIRYVEQGSGAPVVLVHGYTGAIECCWIDTGVMPDLARDHRVIALDLRGHGKSDKPHDPAAYEEIAQDVIRLLDQLGVTSAHIAGFSLGGIIIAKLLTTHPERFISATLVGAAPRRGRGAQSDRAAEAAAVELERGVPYRSLILATAPTDEPPPSEEAVLARSREIVSTNDPLAHAALMRARRALVVADAEMAAVRVPAMAIIGSADPALPRVKALKFRLPGLRLVIVEGATHSARDARSVVRRPEFVDAMREFIRCPEERCR